MTVVGVEPQEETSLRGTGFRLLWCNAVSISMVASADRFTFEWLVAETLDAPDWASGLVLFCLGAPVFAFVLVAGAMADRSDRRRMLIVTQAGGFMVLSLAAAMVWSGLASVGLASVVALAFGLVMAFSQPVRAAMTPMLVPRSSLMHAIVVMTIGSNVAMIAGPLLAGSVIDRWDVGWAFAAQAAFFGVGVVLVLRLHVPPMPVRTEHRRLRVEVSEGWRFVWHHGSLRPLFLLLCVGGGLMMGGATALLPKLARDVFGRSASEASQLFALMGLGMIVTSFFLIRYRQRITRRGLVFMVCMTIGCSNQVLMGAMPTFWSLQLLLLLWGVGGGIYMNLNQTLIQESTPQDHMGRVMSLTSLAQAGLVPIGALVGSALAGAVGPRIAMSTFGAIGLVCVLTALVRAKELRARA